MHMIDYYNNNKILSQFLLKIKLFSKEVKIGSNSWIGEFLFILPGARRGDRPIIGSISVVIENLPDNSIMLGHM